MIIQFGGTKKCMKSKKHLPKKKFELTKEKIPSPLPMGDDTCSLWSWGSRVSRLSLLGRLLSIWSHKFRKVTCKNPAKTTEVARRKFNTIWFEFQHFSRSITLLVRSSKPGWPLMSLGRLKDRLLVRTVHCLTGRSCRTSWLVTFVFASCCAADLSVSRCLREISCVFKCT